MIRDNSSNAVATDGGGAQATQQQATQQQPKMSKLARLREESNEDLASRKKHAVDILTGFLPLGAKFGTSRADRTSTTSTHMAISEVAMRHVLNMDPDAVHPGGLNGMRQSALHQAVNTPGAYRMVHDRINKDLKQQQMDARARLAEREKAEGSGAFRATAMLW